jgi:hypothetical protein
LREKRAFHSVSANSVVDVFRELLVEDGQVSADGCEEIDYDLIDFEVPEPEDDEDLREYLRKIRASLGSHDFVCDGRSDTAFSLQAGWVASERLAKALTEAGIEEIYVLHFGGKIPWKYYRDKYWRVRWPLGWKFVLQAVLTMVPFLSRSGICSPVGVGTNEAKS